MRWVAVAAVVVLMGTVAWAQDRPGPKRNPAQRFKQLDKNGDGYITQDEIPQERKEFFKRLLSRWDKNGDGKLSQEEFLAAASRRGGPRGQRPGEQDRPGPRQPAQLRPVVPPVFRLLDANGDGKITREELAKAVDRLMQLDRNGDGVLTPDEFMPRFRGRGFAGRPGRRPMNPEAVINRIMQFDRNGDGKLTKDEVPERAQRFIFRADLNQDGVVEREELKKFFQQLRNRFGPGRGPRPQPQRQ